MKPTICRLDDFERDLVANVLWWVTHDEDMLRKLAREIAMSTGAIGAAGVCEMLHTITSKLGDS